jgi:hypothetical protein
VRSLSAPELILEAVPELVPAPGKVRDSVTQQQLFGGRPVSAAG